MRISTETNERGVELRRSFRRKERPHLPLVCKDTFPDSFFAAGGCGVAKTPIPLPVWCCCPRAKHDLFLFFQREHGQQQRWFLRWRRRRRRWQQHCPLLCWRRRRRIWISERFLFWPQHALLFVRLLSGKAVRGRTELANDAGKVERVFQPVRLSHGRPRHEGSSYSGKKYYAANM